MTSSSTVASAWRVVARKKVGASHRRKRLENQDAVATLPPKGGTAAAVTVAVADGHGGATSFRSALGSRFGVEVSIQLAEELLASTSAGSPREVKRLLEERAGKQLVREWRKRVAADLADRPLRDDDLARLEESSGPSTVARVRADPFLAYGSTLLGAVAAETFMAFWQLGDGDILAVDADGQVDRPIPADPELLGNATTSLCLPDAWRHVRSAFIGTPTPLVLVTSDGIANSYEDEAGFREFGSEVYRRITTDGLDAVVDRLPWWLREMSDRGSGDDVSIGLLYRAPVSGGADTDVEGVAP